MRLRRRFGHAGIDTGALRAMYRPPAWAQGHVSTDDAIFLAEIIAARQPTCVVEFGVASGASSAAILHALDTLPDPERRALYSCDVRSRCYFDDAYATGQACVEMYPAPAARWQREFQADARRLGTMLPAASVDLTFIDANHAHPWPLLDLLHATRFVNPGSWVVLHDIDLPLHYPAYQIFGPRWLYEAWPFDKIKGTGRWTSIGAVQLPDDPLQLVPAALALIEQPWEQAPNAAAVDLPPAFSTVQAAINARLRRDHPILVA